MSERKDQFMNSIEELSEIVEKLENDKMNIDEAIALYEKGKLKIKACEEILENSVQKIEIFKQNS
ncbi:MAG: exodeoxyribonuclease VII small subunit [Eubacteriales bacterium]|nr:exodeoxyribonuclease VII small subunit [Eubacteriales bacterium]MDY3333218.1 exodeoxyribonuclease VII small subunit [Gallibacter sp.]